MRSTTSRLTEPARFWAIPSKRVLSERFWVADDLKQSPLLIGAIKSNFGHLEAAAGIAGFIKTVLAVQCASIPRNLHFQTPNPHIAFDQMRLKVVAEQQEWPSGGHLRRAGVSSFGFGGTNAHVVLEQAPAVGPVVQQDDPGGDDVADLGEDRGADRLEAGRAGRMDAGDGAEVRWPMSLTRSATTGSAIANSPRSVPVIATRQSPVCRRWPRPHG